MKIKHNYQKIAISNIIQQIISILTTILLIKYIGSELYSEVVYFFTIGNTLIIFASCWINPFYIREGSIEYNDNRNLEKTLVSIFVSIIIYFLLLIILKELIIERIINISEFFWLLIIFTLGQVLAIISKNTFRIKKKINAYCMIIILEKLFFFISIIIYFKITVGSKVSDILFISAISYLLIGFLFFFKIKKDISLKLPNKLFLKKYLINSFFIFIATFVVYFSSFEYLIIIIANTSFLKIITYMSIAVMISNIAYMPIYWLEQLSNPKINIIFNNQNNFEKINYYKNIVLPILNIILLIQLLLSIILFNSKILNIIFDSTFQNNINLILLILSTCLTKSIDTLFSMPLLANRKEKKIMFFNITRTIIFLLFFFTDQENIMRLVYVFLCLNLFQNIFYIFESKKIINEYYFLSEALLVIINLIFIFLLIYSIQLVNLLIIPIIFIVLNIYMKKNIYILEIKKFTNI
jgi:O-antigen/teichoic acid export membrane protein